jgi:mono/diheme cytochrome c family protein
MTRGWEMRSVMGILMLAATSAQAQVPDVARGRALYENHCQVCHTGKVHVRPNRIVLTRRDATELVEHWQAQEKLNWGEQEVRDVVEYLARNVYGFD